jgi:hypothetical protein
MTIDDKKDCSRSFSEMGWILGRESEGPEYEIGDLSASCGRVEGERGPLL